MAEQTGLDNHCIVELFGHQKIVGKVTELVIAGQGFLRIDVPATKRQPAFTRIFGASAIYSITPVSEDIALRAAQSMYIEPVTVYIKPDRQLSAPNDEDGDDGMDEMDGAGPGEDNDDD